MEKKPINAFCVHGHFYQPTREDPLTGIIPEEKGAAPYTNWNERINDQCYRPNAELKNFEGISFNIGPTLAEWLAESDPDTLKKIIEQDHVNVRRYGVGNAMAQAYHHTILPLSTRQDKQTQIIWGIEDFVQRFSHHPAGMWLPETAVDLETLDILAQNGIQFTILAPWQAKKKDIDVSQPYWVECYEGRRIVVFFYHQDLSTRVSFDPGATANADLFTYKILLPQFDHTEKPSGKDQLLIIASDGEAYGHHHPYRDKFLSYLLRNAINGYPIRKSFPALWLQTHPPTETIEINENTSWSCHHGIKRWAEECDCTPNGSWKKALRSALNEIAGAVDEEFINVVEQYDVDPWNLRNDYIRVINNLIEKREFIRGHIPEPLSHEEIGTIELLLEAQFERQRCFASCGWFFDDFDRIEPTNNVKYAAQAVWLTARATGRDLSALAEGVLKEVKSGRTSLTGDQVFCAYLDRIQQMNCEAEERTT